MSRFVCVVAAIGVLGAAGCTAIQRSDAMSAERTLAAAGFRMKFAKTPEQTSKLESLPQRTLTPAPGPDGSNRFLYADAKFCKCLYVGTEEAYDRYQKMEVRQQVAENMEAASMNWGAWGPWW